MTLEEAIEIITQLRRLYLHTLTKASIDALALGIEALKAVKDDRVKGYWRHIPTLPGETEE